MKGRYDVSMPLNTLTVLSADSSKRTCLMQFVLMFNVSPA